MGGSERRMLMYLSQLPRIRRMTNTTVRERALILCDGYYGTNAGKTANGLVRHSARYAIVGVVDRATAGADAGALLDGVPRNIPIVASLEEGIDRCRPDTVIIGVATFGGYIPAEFRPAIRAAIERGLNVVSGLHEYLAEDPEFAPLAAKHGVALVDVRRPRPLRELRQFSDIVRSLPCLRLPVLGTDGSIGKRTTAILLTGALNATGVKATFVATGQTGLLQGAEYGVAIDGIRGDFVVGELEWQIARAYAETKPRVVVVEGQGSISHPSYVTGTRAILMASMPQAMVLQHAPARVTRNFRREVVAWPMPSLEDEIRMLESSSSGKVVALALNHEDMTREQVDATTREYEAKYGLPTCDPLWHGVDKLVSAVRSQLP